MGIGAHSLLQTIGQPEQYVKYVRIPKYIAPGAVGKICKHSKVHSYGLCDAIYYSFGGFAIRCAEKSKVCLLLSRLKSSTIDIPEALRGGLHPGAALTLVTKELH